MDKGREGGGTLERKISHLKITQVVFFFFGKFYEEKVLRKRREMVITGTTAKRKNCEKTKAEEKA